MATKFKVKRSTVSGVTPTTGDIDSAELAINIPDRKLFSSNGTAIFELGSNLTNLSVSANLTIASTGDIVLTPGAGIFANGSVGSNGNILYSNGSSVFWGAANAGISSVVSQRFTANGTANSFTVTGGYIPSAIEVYVTGIKKIPVTEVDITSGTTINFITPPLNGQIVDVFGYQSVGSVASFLALTGGTLSGNLTFTNGSVIVSNGSFGTNGQVLTSNGTSMYWSSAGFTNGQSISVNNFVITGAFTANGANGTAGQVLTTNGSSVYWSSAGVNAAAQYAWTNTHSFAANLTILGTSELIIANGAGIEANGSLGTPGLVLHSNGSSVYWAQANSGLSEVVTQQFTANGTANSFLVTGGYFPNAIEVYLAGVKQVPGTDVTISSGSTVNFAVTPLNGQVVDVFGYRAANNLQSISAIVSQQFTANGTTNTFTITPGYIPNAIEVYVSGVKRIPVVDVDITSGSTITFTTAPLNGQVVDVFGYRSVGAVSPYLDTAGGTMTGNVTFTNGAVIVANAAFGTNGQVLTSNGTSMYWSSAGFTNGQSISVNNFVVTGAFTANGANGTAGQVLTTSGTGVYWSSAGVNTAAQYAWTNTHTFAANVTFNTGTLFVDATNDRVGLGNTTPDARLTVTGAANVSGNVVIGGTATVSGNLTIATTSELIVANGAGIQANGSFGSAGQVLTTSGTGVYWSSAGVNTAAQFSWTNTHSFSSNVTISNTLILSNTFVTDITNTNFGQLTANTFTNRLVLYGDMAFVNFTEVGGLQMRYARGTIGSPTSVQDGDRLGSFFHGGYHLGLNSGAGGWINGVQIASFVDGNTSTVSTNIPTRLAFSTTPLNGSRTERMRITANGNVGIGTTSPAVRLAVSSTDAIQIPAGTTAERPSAANGMIRYNTNTQTIEAVANNTWTNMLAAYSSVREQFTASNNQTTFTVTGGYVPGQVDVYYNGVKLRSGSEVNVSSGNSVILAVGAANNALIEVVGIGPTFVVSNTAQIVYQQFTASNNQTTFTVTNGYVPGQVDVFADGVKLVNGVDVNVSSGGNIVLSTGVPNNTIIEVKGYSTPIVSAQSSTAVRQTFIANSTSNNNFVVTGGYIPGQVDVFYNGAKLVNGTDVNTSSGTTIFLAANAAVNAIVDVVGINYFTAGGGVTTPVRQQLVATANQTTFTITGGYTPGQIDVFRNGVKLTPGADVNISGGSTVVLSSPAANGDNIDVVGFAATSYQDSVRKSGDTISGSLAISSNLAVTGAATFSNTIAVTGTSTLTGNVTTSGVFADATGIIRPLILGTVQNTTSGTFVDFTGIPSWVRRISVMLNGFSTNGSDRGLIQLGTSSGLTTTGYTSYGGYISNANTQDVNNSTAGLIWWHAGATDVEILNMIITNMGGNVWLASHSGGFTNGGQLFSLSGGGSVTLSGTLDRLRITTTGGTNTLDAGTVNILYE